MLTSLSRELWQFLSTKDNKSNNNADENNKNRFGTFDVVLFMVNFLVLPVMPMAIEDIRIDKVLVSPEITLQIR